MVIKFPVVFLDDLPGVPLDRKIEFGIDLVSYSHPISIPSYTMASTEFIKLKEQLKNLLEKGLFILVFLHWVHWCFLCSIKMVYFGCALTTASCTR